MIIQSVSVNPTFVLLFETKETFTINNPESDDATDGPVSKGFTMYPSEFVNAITLTIVLFLRAGKKTIASRWLTMSTQFSNVTADTFTGSVLGNASTATALQTARTINGTNFNGTSNITITAAAGTLTGTTLNSTVVSSSLTSVGTIGTGTWQGSVIGGDYGGTGVANTGKTITLGGNLTTTPSNNVTFTTTGATNVTLPTSGTLLTSGTGVSSITGTSNQVNASASTGAVTLSLPQSIATSSTPQFGGMDIKGDQNVGLTVTSTSSQKGVNEGYLTLNRFDLQGYAQLHFGEGSAQYWALGMRQNDNDLHIFDTTTSTNLMQIRGGSGTSSILGFAGTVAANDVTANGTVIANTFNGPNLTASRAVVTDESKNFASLQYTDTNTASTLMSRDEKGNFSSGTASLTNLTVTKDAFTCSMPTLTYASTFTPYLNTLVSGITITAVTSNPTKASGIWVDRIEGYKSGGWGILIYTYAQSNVTNAAAGSGDYLFALPSGYAFDTARNPAVTAAFNTVNILSAASEQYFASIVGTGVARSSAEQLIPVVYSSSTFRISRTASAGCVRSNLYQMTAANLGYQVRLQFLLG